jgi:polar amino acid transport system substrate-binding protein
MNIIKKILICFTLLISGCSENSTNEKHLTFGVSSEYPPFEFIKNGKIVGFDIDVAIAVAKEMGMEASFKDMKFASILPSVDSGLVHAGISAINITPQRAANYDFTIPYHFFSIAALYKADLNIQKPDDLKNSRISCQIGTSSENWIKKTFPGKELTAFDGTNQAIEFLKSGRGDVVIVDGEVAIGFAKANPGFKYIIVEKSIEGVGIALKKGSPLISKMNAAIKAIETNGTLKNLKKKWEID